MRGQERTVGTMVQQITVQTKTKSVSFLSQSHQACNDDEAIIFSRGVRIRDGFGA